MSSIRRTARASGRLAWPTAALVILVSSAAIWIGIVLLLAWLA